MRLTNSFGLVKVFYFGPLNPGVLLVMLRYFGENGGLYLPDAIRSNYCRAPF